MSIEYCIFKVIEPNKPLNPFYMSFVRLSSVSVVLNWMIKEREAYRKWWTGSSDKFLKSFLMFNENRDLEIEPVENFDGGSDNDVLQRIKELCQNKRSYNNYGYELLEPIYSKRLQHLKSILKDRLRYRDDLVAELEEVCDDRKIMEKKLVEVEDRIFEIERSINIQENFREMKPIKPPQKEKKLEKVINTAFVSKSPFEILAQSAKPYIPAHKRKKIQ